ncbi:Uncharacterized protein (Fragment) [Durusdinium trenchii]|uniref:Uncharacterized protein n=1 Tax=Durusdinium trenchii TaxID=1381693 RepID=A0ABP0Q7C9_9DINO
MAQYATSAGWQHHQVQAQLQQQQQYPHLLWPQQNAFLATGSASCWSWRPASPAQPLQSLWPPRSPSPPWEPPVRDPAVEAMIQELGITASEEKDFAWTRGRSGESVTGRPRRPKDIGGAKPTYHEVPARHQHFERLDSEDELRGIEEACFIRWSTAAQDAADLASEPSTSSRYRAQGDGKGAELPTPRLTKRRLKATQVQADMIWRKYYIPASRLPELLAQREEQHTKFKELQSKSTEAKNKWHRAFDFMMEGNDVDRALRNVRDISSKIRQYMFFGESENAVLKLQSTLAQYHRTWDQKRYGRLTAGLSDIARLAYPIEQLIDTRTFECHEIVQQELSVAIQNELTRRAEPMELQRMDRETDNVLQQSEVARSSINRKLDDLRHSIQRTARDAGAFIQRVKMTLQQVLADINEFTTAHANMKKAEKDYKADMFDQQRRNDGYKESLEKLEARRCLDCYDQARTL